MNVEALGAVLAQCLQSDPLLADDVGNASSSLRVYTLATRIENSDNNKQSETREPTHNLFGRALA